MRVKEYGRCVKWCKGSNMCMIEILEQPKRKKGAEEISEEIVVSFVLVKNKIK